jgi:exopolysaccharide production protein ExoZ
MLTSVQVLRGIAALMVVIFHVPTAIGLRDLNIPILSSGVDMFFVISGFVMVLATAERRRDAVTFVAQRFKRIVPFYWVMTLVMAGSLLLFSERVVSLEEIAKSMLFVPYLDTTSGFVQPVLGVGWTLNLEILFYLLFAATMALSALAQVATIGLIFAGAVLARIIFSPADDTVLFFYTTPVLFEFLAGILIGYQLHRIRRLPTAVGALAVGFAVISIFVMRFGFTLPRTAEQGIPAAMMVVGCIRLEHYFKKYAPMALSRLGDASYSLYLVHPIVLLAAAPIVAATNVSHWLSGGFVVSVCIVASMVTYKYVEKPILAVSRLCQFPRTAKV